MAVELFLSSDTLETGFRQKANESFGAIIVAATPVMASGIFTGVIRLSCYDGSFINLDLSSVYYTQTQISQIINALTSSPYSGAWNNAFPGGYSANAVVDYNGELWRSASNNNTDTPGTTSSWMQIIFQTSGSIQVGFTNVSSMAINWQTDIPSGETGTYATVFGNTPPQMVIDIETGNPNEYQRIPFDLKYTIVDGLIQTLTLDWSVSQTGNIIFKL